MHVAISVHLLLDFSVGSAQSVFRHYKRLFAPVIFFKKTQCHITVDLNMNKR